MILTFALVVAAGVLAAALIVGRAVMLRRARARLVECPENQRPAAVNATALAGGRFSLASCSRWPDRQSCGRECLAQIERAPDDCLVRNVVTKWYDGKTCSVCRRPLGTIDWLERKPGFVDEAGRARPWLDLAPEELPRALTEDQPICFDCYVAATFRREHPDLVLDNPWKS